MLVSVGRRQPGAHSVTDFCGFGRYGVEDGDGTYEIVTVKAEVGPASGGSLQAPHIDVSLFARGLLHRVVTRILFADEAEANAACPVPQNVSTARRQTLLAVAIAAGTGSLSEAVEVSHRSAGAAK